MRDWQSWQKAKFNRRHRKDWLFVLNHQGIAFRPEAGQSGLVYWFGWAEIKSISLKKSMILKRPYWQTECHLAQLGKHNLSLQPLGEIERESAQKMAQAYFQAACNKSI